MSFRGLKSDIVIGIGTILKIVIGQYFIFLEVWQVGGFYHTSREPKISLSQALPSIVWLFYIKSQLF